MESKNLFFSDILWEINKFIEDDENTVRSLKNTCVNTYYYKYNIHIKKANNNILNFEKLYNITGVGNSNLSFFLNLENLKTLYITKNNYPANFYECIHNDINVHIHYEISLMKNFKTFYTIKTSKLQGLIMFYIDKINITSNNSEFLRSVKIKNVLCDKLDDINYLLQIPNFTNHQNFSYKNHSPTLLLVDNTTKIPSYKMCLKNFKPHPDSPNQIDISHLFKNI